MVRRRVSDVTVHYVKAPDGTEDLVSGATHGGHTVDGRSLAGTGFQLYFYCSRSVTDRYLSWLGTDPHQSLHRAAAFQCLLWLEHYRPSWQWHMDEDRLLWDDAVLRLIAELQSSQ